MRGAVELVRPGVSLGPLRVIWAFVVQKAPCTTAGSDRSWTDLPMRRPQHVRARPDRRAEPCTHRCTDTSRNGDCAPGAFHGMVVDPQKTASSSYVQPQLVAVGDWWLMAVGSGWRLAVGRRWRLAAVGHQGKSVYATTITTIATMTATTIRVGGAVGRMAIWLSKCAGGASGCAHQFGGFRNESSTSRVPIHRGNAFPTGESGTVVVPLLKSAAAPPRRPPRAGRRQTSD